jgi:hypothetical protein
MGMLYSYIPIKQSEIDYLLDDPDLAEDFMEENADRSQDIDKAWHGLHFLLTGDSKPAQFPIGFIMDGGEILSGDEVPIVRIFRPHEVKSIAEAVANSRWSALRERFDPKALTEAQVYPDIWENESALDYLKENYEQLRRDIGQAAAHHNGLLICIG